SNTLDYSNRGTGVLVNLQTHFATATSGSASIQSVRGASAATNNSLTGLDARSAERRVGTDTRSVAGVNYAAMQYLTGGAANDTLAFAAGASSGGKISGAGGSNTLDYSNRGAGVLVNLQTHFATATSGGASIQTVRGASAATNNSLTGLDA